MVAQAVCLCPDADRVPPAELLESLARAITGAVPIALPWGSPTDLVAPLLGD
jgi:hypothetical protein